jgi:hypothetical protein
MKHYRAAAIVLLAASAALLLVVVKSFSRAHRAAAGLVAGKQAVAMAQAQLTAAQRAVTVARAKGARADRFLDTWTNELDAESNIERVFGKLDTLAVNNLLAPSGKTFTSNMNYFFNGRHLPVQHVNMSVAGDYARTLNWLGAVEGAFPLARVEQISYTNSGNSLSLAVQFVFPRKFDTE